MRTYAIYKPKIEIIDDLEALARKSALLFISDANKAISNKKFFYVAISGGHSPERFFEMLSELPQAKSLQWNRVQLFWVDERIVPLDSPYSNYKLARDTFLTKIPIPPQNIHRIPTEYSDFEVAARCYEQTIRKVFHLEEKKLPCFDLIVLGMGSDGHTASMMPNCYAPFNVEDLACVVYVMDDRLNRITLTHPVLCAARHLMVLVSGKEKAETLKDVLTSTPDEVRYPIHVLWPVLDKITWLVDKQAGRLL